jgi:hypothetical protein
MKADAPRREALVINWKLLSIMAVVVLAIVLVAGVAWLHLAALLGELN